MGIDLRAVGLGLVSGAALGFLLWPNPISMAWMVICVVFSLTVWVLKK